MKFMPLVLAFLCLSAVGCSLGQTLTHELDSLSDDQLASYLEKGAHQATAIGVKYAVRKNPDKTNQITKDGATAEQLIRQVILLDFTGGSSGAVLKGAIDLGISKLASKLSGSPIDTIVMIADTVAAQIPLPTNPTSKLSPRLQKAVAGFFLGMAEGLDDALGLPPPVVPPAPTPPPPPPK